MSQTQNAAIAVVGIDIGKNSSTSWATMSVARLCCVRMVAWPGRGPLCQHAAVPGRQACVGAHHLSRKLNSLGHNARLMPAKYVRPYSRGQKNDFRDAEAIAEAVQRPTMKFVATKRAKAWNRLFALSISNISRRPRPIFSF